MTVLGSNYWKISSRSVVTATKFDSIFTQTSSFICQIKFFLPKRLAKVAPQNLIDETNFMRIFSFYEWASVGVPNYTPEILKLFVIRPKWDLSILNSKGYENFSVSNSGNSWILHYIDLEKFFWQGSSN
jgi:hypothetical protein